MYTGRDLTRPVYRRRSNPTSIQKERSDMYRGKAIPHLYRKTDLTCIQEERSLMYTGRYLTPYVYRDNFSYLKSFVKEKTIKHVDWKSRKRNG